MARLPDSYYEEIHGKLTAIFIELSDLLPQSTREFIAEELDANELGLVLEVMVDAMAEQGVVVDADLGGQSRRIRADDADPSRYPVATQDDEFWDLMVGRSADLYGRIRKDT